MKRLLILLSATLWSIGLYAQSEVLHMSNIERTSTDASLGDCALLKISSAMGDLFFEETTTQERLNAMREQTGNGYVYNIRIDLSDEEKRNLKPNIRVGRSGSTATTKRQHKFRVGEIATCTVVGESKRLLSIDEEIRPDARASNNDLSVIEIYSKEKDVRIEVPGMQTDRFIDCNDQWKRIKPTGDDIKTTDPVAIYYRYQIEQGVAENGLNKYTIIIDLQPHKQLIESAAYEASATDVRKRDELDELTENLLSPRLIITSGDYQRETQIHGLKPRGLCIIEVSIPVSQLQSNLTAADQAFETGLYRDAYAQYMAIYNDPACDAATKTRVRQSVNNSAKCDKIQRAYRLFYTRGEYHRKQGTFTEVDSVRLFYDRCETVGKELLKINPKDAECIETLQQIAARRHLLKRVVYGSVVDNMRQNVAIANCSVYAVPSYYVDNPQKAQTGAFLLGQSAADGSFRFDVEDNCAGLYFVHETDKNYMTPTFERLPINLNRKLFIKMRPKKLY